MRYDPSFDREALELTRDCHQDEEAREARREARRKTVELEKRLAAAEGFRYFEATDGPNT